MLQLRDGFWMDIACKTLAALFYQTKRQSLKNISPFLPLPQKKLT